MLWGHGRARQRSISILRVALCCYLLLLFASCCFLNFLLLLDASCCLFLVASCCFVLLLVAFCCFLLLIVASCCLCNSCQFSRGQAGGTCDTCCGVTGERAGGHVTHVVGSWTSAPEEHQHASRCCLLLLVASSCFLLLLDASCCFLLFLVASYCFLLLLR